MYTTVVDSTSNTYLLSVVDRTPEGALQYCTSHYSNIFMNANAQISNVFHHQILIACSSAPELQSK